MPKKKDVDEEKSKKIDSVDEEKKDITKIKDYVESGKVRKTSKKNNDSKVIFIKRFIAYVFDIVIVLLVASLLSSPFMDTEKINDLSTEFSNLVYNDQDISNEEYNIQYTNIMYKLAKEEGLYSLFTMFLTILYFVVLPLYYNGQTLGKKITKIKVVSDVGDLSVNQLIFRTFIADFLLYYIITFIFMLTLSKANYSNFSSVVSSIQYCIMFISMFMVMFRSDGRSIHDIICKTRVVNVDE